MKSLLDYSPAMQLAQQNQSPVVALESAVITHGLPYPENVELAKSLEEVVHAQHATPATIALINGRIKIGLSTPELEHLSLPGTKTRKISRRDFGIAMANKMNGGTTVSATLIAAHLAGIKVFATGGIGGVHRNAPFDVSSDLQELAKTPIIVTCAGAKSILDLPATLEILETNGVPVLGFQTDEFPAFYSRHSGLGVDYTVNSAAEVVKIAMHQWEMGIHSAILVVIPPPAEYALPYEEVEEHIQIALSEANQQNIKGAKVTPFLLSRVSALSQGSSLKANLSLLKNNAAIASEIAVEFTANKNPKKSY